MHTALPLRAAAAFTALALTAAALSACSSSSAPEENPNYTTTPSDEFPVTVEHQFGETTIPAEPQRIVVVGVTEQDILLELGMPPIATTEWYGEQPYAVWPWATELLGDAEPVVLDQTDGFEFEKIASLRPDLIVGTNAGLDEDTYDKLSKIAPTVAQIDGTEAYFSDWKEQTLIISAAVGRSAEGEELIVEVEDAYAEAAAAHPEWKGLSATFSQGGAWEGNLYVYPDGLNTDFLTELGFVMTPGLEAYADEPGSQALISPENVGLLEADVVVFATEEEGAIEDLLSFGTLSSLPAVVENRSVYTDGELAGAIYFLTPLSQKYVIEKLVPRLEDAVAGTAPRDIAG
ncbi:ABC transporter substrate-binding protein [Microbacterium sp.]|uniref:ABC transporter substrate-binding protein n=1 Tax=Microbacterium sp. TaxID=51671 RepID=UPI0039E2EA81